MFAYGDRREDNSRAWIGLGVLRPLEGDKPSSTRRQSSRHVVIRG